MSLVATMFEPSSPNLVYKRKKVQKSPASSVSCQYPASLPPDEIKFVYQRRNFLSCHYSASLPPDEIKFVYQKRKLWKHSAPSMVYRQRKAPECPVSVPSCHLFCSLPPDEIKFVYQRRKLLKNLGSAQMSANPTSTNPSSVAMEKYGSSGVLDDAEAVGSSFMSAIICNVDPQSTNSETGDGCVVVENRAYDGQPKRPGSVDDSCSSSVLNMDVSSTGLNNEVDDTAECSSSGAIVGEPMAEDLSVKELCVNILRSHGLLSSSRQNRHDIVGSDTPSSSGGSNYRVCSSCSNIETASKMLICDQCEAAFHILCCDPSLRKIPDDEWHCPSCYNKKRKIMRDTAGKSQIMKTGTSFGRSTGDCGPIALMLQDTEPHSSSIRVGKGFQADVPEWTGPVSEAFYVVGQPEELNPSYQKYNPKEPLGSDAICSTWLQCRQVINGLEKGINGTICGKWRRAPPSEVQTDNWDCFCCVFWDPLHADCAVPQELDTHEVLKQLKYKEKTRARKRQRCDVSLEAPQGLPLQTV